MNHPELISVMEKYLEGSWKLDGNEKYITFHLPEHSGSKGRLQSGDSTNYNDDEDLQYQVKIQGGLFHMITHDKEYAGYKEFAVSKMHSTNGEGLGFHNIETNERLTYYRQDT